VTQGPKARPLSFLAFLFNNIPHCICFKILFTESNYLVSNRGYTRWIRTLKKVKKLNRNFNIFCVIIILCNHRFILLILFWAIKHFILFQINQPALKSCYHLTFYNKFTDPSWVEELQTRQPLSPIWASSSISRKRQAAGFVPLHHILVYWKTWLLNCNACRDYKVYWPNEFTRCSNEVVRGF